MLSPNQISELIQDRLLPAYNADKERFETIVEWLRGDALTLYLPKGADAEYELLRKQSKFNVLKLVVKQLAQDLVVDGYRPTAESGLPVSSNAPIWDMVWQPNRMDARQRMLYKAAIKFGWSYATVLPGARQRPGRPEEQVDQLPDRTYSLVDEAVPVITPYSPRQFVACYADRYNDEWAECAMHLDRPTTKQAKGGSEPYDPDIDAKLRIYDAEHVYDVVKAKAGSGSRWEILGEASKHGMGVVPVVRWMDEWDCDEMPEGKVWSLITPQQQLDQTSFSILLIQNFASWRQRWISGMEEEDPGFRARIDAVWKSTDSNTKFGEFTASDPTPLLRSREAQLQFISAVGQVAPHQLVLAAGIANISADALVALQTSHDHDVNDHKITFGESDEQMIRLGGLAIAHTPEATDEQRAIGMAAWYDRSAQVIWRDTTPRSLAQIADALGKLATQLEIPPEALWERIPGATQQDIERWRELRGQRDQRLIADVQRMVDRGEDVMDRPPAEEPEPVGVPGNGSAPT